VNVIHLDIFVGKEEREPGFGMTFGKDRKIFSISLAVNQWSVWMK